MDLFKEYDIKNINTAKADFARLSKKNLDCQALLLLIDFNGESGFDAELEKIGVSMGSRVKLRHVFAQERKKKRFFLFRLF